MAVQGISARDFFDLARFAWITYENIKLSRQNFTNLSVDVECLLISVSALDQGHTGRLVTEYIDSDPSLAAYISEDIAAGTTTTDKPSISQRQLEVRALRDGLHSVIFPFYVFLEKHTSAFGNTSAGGSGDDIDSIDRGPRIKGLIGRDPRTSMGSSRPSESDTYAADFKISDAQGRSDRKMWDKLPLWVRRLYASFDLKDMSEIRSRFAVQAANLNLFLTRLTHAQLQKQTEMLTLRLAEDNLLSENWEYSRDLKKGEAKFREDVAVYVRHLLKGGMPFTEQELRRKAIDDDFAKQRREDRMWAAQKIAEENKRREQLERDERRRYSRERIYHDDVAARRHRRYESLGSAEEPFTQYEEVELPTEVISQSERQSSGRDSGLSRPVRARRENPAYAKSSPSRNPLEAGLSPDAVKTLDEARMRLRRAEDEGLLTDYTAVDDQSLDDPATPAPRRRADTLTVNRDDAKRHSFPGIMVSPPTQHSEPTSKEGKRISSSASPNGRRYSSQQSSPSTNVPASPKVVQGDSAQHPSSTSSPRVAPAQPVRRPSTPATSATTSNEKPSSTPRRSPTRVLLCDQCNASIYRNEYFWRCATGKCAVDGNTFDVCRKCNERGYHCRGMDQGTCPKMVCTMIKASSP